MRRALVLCLGLIALLCARPARISAQSSRPEANKRRDDASHLTPGQRTALTNRIAQWSKILEECRAGRRNDSDKFFALRGLLMDYGRLGMRNSADAEAALQKYRALIRTHPEFRAHPPQQLSDAINRRKKEAAETEAAKEESIHPSDSRPMVAYQDSDSVAVLYQYHIDFYRKPRDSEVKLVDSGPAFKKPRLFKKGEPLPGSALKRLKTLSFQYPFAHAPFALGQALVKGDFWVCTDLLVNYSPTTPAERRIILAKYHAYVMPWTNTAGEVKDFCGALSLGGEVLYRIPATQHDPDTLLDLRMTSDDGNRALIYVGKRVTNYDGGDETPAVGDCREILIWERPRKLIRIDPDSMTVPEVLRTLKSYGFHGVFATWKGRFNP